VGVSYKMESSRGCPVREGEVLEAVVVKTGEEGDGIAKLGGFIIIIPGTCVGEKVKAKITKVVQNCAFAKVVT